MPALTAAQYDILTTQIEIAFHKHRQFELCSLTADDIYNAFVQPEDVESCKKAMMLWANRFMYTAERIQLSQKTPYFSRPLSVSLHINKTLALPDYAMNKTSIPPGPLGERIVQEVNSFAKMFHDYNLMTAVLTHLNNICATPSQIAFLWPIIRELAAAASSSEQKVETLLKALDKGTTAPMPRVSAGLRDACKETATTMTVLKMIGEPPATPDNHPIHMLFGNFVSVRQVFDSTMSAKLQ